MEIRSLKNLDPDERFRAFREAFKDYELQLDQPGLEKMLQRRGFDPALSFGAFDQERLVAFTFNGIGTFGGRKTAYDTGTGTIREYRGKGLATRIFQHSQPHLKNAGVRLYLLEVLQHNASAVRLYQRLGFEVTREFNYYIQKKADLHISVKTSGPAYVCEPVQVADLIEALDYMDFQPSWQNSYDSISRGVSEFRAMAITFENRIVACCIFEPGSGDITCLAVYQAHRRKGLGTHLLGAVIREIPSETIKVINIPMDAEGVIAFLSSCKMQLTGQQFEMVREIP